LDSSQNVYNVVPEPGPNLSISKVNSSGTLGWSLSEAPSTDYEWDSATSIVKMDSSGNLLVCCQEGSTSGETAKVAIYKISSSGTLTASAFY
jgi:hypothetical protein